MNNTEFVEFLRKCNGEFNRPVCPKQLYNCQSCFDLCYYNTCQDNYSCIRGCFYYAMHYAPAYISEIYHFLSASKIIEQIGHNTVVVCSLGGGMGTDFCAIKHYISNKNLGINLSYTLFDKERQWQEIINQYDPVLTISVVDLTETTIQFNDTDIVFVNKLFSTLVSNNVSDAFLTRFFRSLKSLRTGAYVVFNDVNLQDKGRDIFDKQIVRNGFTPKGRFYFPIENAYTGNYTPINSMRLIYNCSALNLSCSIMDSVRKTVFFYYQKDA